MLVTHGRRSVPRVAPLALATSVVAALLVALSSAAPAQAEVRPHPTLVPEVPAMGYPIILKTPLLPDEDTPRWDRPQSREVLVADQVGRAIVSGGNFAEIQLQDGSVIQQNYFAAWSIDSKQMLCQQQLTFNNEVLAVAPGPTPSEVYVGGRFTKVAGADGVERNRSRLALIDLSDCSVGLAFKPTGINNKVNNIVRSGDRLFIGGDFDQVAGQAIETVAELNPTTAAPLTAFSFSTAGELTSRIRGMGANPDGTRLVIAGRFGTISRGGVSIPAPTAVIDISDPAAPGLTAHRSSSSIAVKDLQDASVSPDGAWVGLAYGTATVSDYVFLFPTTEAPVTRRWVHFMRDSAFGIGVSNNAVYVTGHFCKPDAGPGSTELMEPQMGFNTCGGTGFAGGAWRSHIAALSVTDGTPLAWNPGQGSYRGATEVTVTTRGLLVGYDGERTADRLVGALAFFDLGASVEDVTPPGSVRFTSPTAGQALNDPALFTGTATDDVGVASYRVAIRASDGRWLQSNGSLGATRQDFTTPATADGGFSLSLSMPPGTYTAYARAVDGAGLRSATETAVTFTETGIEGIRPESTIEVPAGSIFTEANLSITGVATDNSAVASIVARVRDSAGRYVQDDLTLGAADNDLPVTVTTGGFGTTAVGWSISLGNRLPAGSYQFDVVVTDRSGNTTTVSRPFTVEPNAPTVAVTAPTTAISNEERVVVTGTATDDTQVSSVRLRIRNEAGEYLRNDGSFGATQDLNVEVTGRGTPNATFRFDAGHLRLGNYEVVATATDGVGNSTTRTSAFTVTDVVTTTRPLVTSRGGFTTTKSGDYTIGFVFTVTQATTITSLGIFDTDGDGVNDNPADTPIGIWRNGAATPLAQTVVPTGGRSDGGWFYGDLGTPLVLQPNTTYVVAQGTFATGEKYASGGTMAADPILKPTGSAWVAGRLKYPTNREATFYAVPNLRFVTTTTARPTVTMTAPAAFVESGTGASIDASATDNVEVSTLTARIVDDAGQFLQDDGRFTATPNDLPATVTGTETPTASLRFFSQPLPTGTYTATVTAVDSVGNTDTATREFTVAATPPFRLAFSNYTGYQNVNGNWSLGYRFQVTSPTTLTEVGIHDANGDGQFGNTVNTPFAIWRASGPLKLADGFVAPGTAAENGWFFGKLATPLELTPGVTYVVAYRSYAAGEPLSQQGSWTADPLFNWMSRVYVSTSGTGLVYPTVTGAGNGYGLNLKLSS